MSCCPAARALKRKERSPAPNGASRRLYQVFEPLEGSRPDWKIVQEVANRLGAGWKYQHPSEIMDEIAALTPMFAGVNYGGWKDTNPCSGRLLLTEPMNLCSIPNDSPFRTEKPDCFRSHGAAPEQPNAEFDLHLNNGRLLEHFHEGNLTYRSPASARRLRIHSSKSRRRLRFNGRIVMTLVFTLRSQ